MTPTSLAICVDGLGEHWLGGVNYFRNLLLVFDAAADPDLRLHLLTDNPAFLADLQLSPRVQVHRVGMLKRKSMSWVLRKALHVLTGRDVLLLSRLRRLDVRAVVFSYVAGARSAGMQCVPWIPDFQFKHLPGLFPAATVAAEEERAHRFVRVADGLVLSSQSACEDAVKFFGADRQRLHVVRFAPKVDFAPLLCTTRRDEVLARYGIDRPYVFLPNQYWKHKNHQLVADALRLLRQAQRDRPLVISTGKTADLRDERYFGDFETTLRVGQLDDSYRILGVIPREDMLVLLAHCMAVLNPSRFEGWSTTVEEAKALGKRLLVSDIPVHREQVAALPDAQSFGTDDPARLSDLLGNLQAEYGGGATTAHPPQPRPELFASFSKQYIALLKRLVRPDGVKA